MNKLETQWQTIICPTCNHDVRTNAPDKFLSRINSALARERQEARAAAFKEARERIEAVNPPLTYGSANGSMMKKCVLAEIDALEAATTKQPELCPDCADAARLAYSDATTPGFFNPKCAKHSAKQPDEVKEGNDGNTAS